jgi:hypothetical protein
VLYENASVSERETLPPAVAVSTVAFALDPPTGAALDPSAAGSADSAALWIPLVRRIRAPFKGLWALPGGPTRWNETLADTALRTLHDAVSRNPGYLEQLYSFGGVERSAQAQRLVTIAYWALYGEGDLASDPEPTRASEEGTLGANSRWDGPTTSLEQHTITPPDADDPNVAWFSADCLPDLAFDHSEIVAYALARLRSKAEYSAVAHRFLGPVFTLAQLRLVHEAVRGQAVDPANFRRQVLAQGYLVDTGERETGTHHRPARLYRFAGDDAARSAAPDQHLSPETSAAHKTPTPTTSRSHP